MLIILGGLPGSGKTTISRRLAEVLKATYLRIDSIEAGIKKSALAVEQAEDAGYLAAFEVARDNLALGHIVVTDSVNPIEISREGWRQVAMKEGIRFLEVEVVCSNQDVHQKRLQERNADLEETTPIVRWKDVLEREYEVWQTASLRLDTSKMTIEECVEMISKSLNG